MPLVHPGPTRQQVQRVGQPPVQPVEAEGRHPGGGQLDRQRHPVEPAADARDTAVVVRVRRRPARHRRAFAEQGRRVALVRVRPLVTLERHAGHGEHELEGHPQPGPAGGQHDDARAGGQQSLDQGADPVEQVLAVVQHQEQVGAGELGDHRVRGRPPRLLPEPEGVRQRGAHHRRVRDRHQVDVAGTARMTAADVLGDGQGQPGLANAPRADGGDQPMLGESTREGGPLGRPAHEGGQRCRQRRDGRQCRVERRGVRPVPGELGQRATVGHPELAQQR